MKGFAAAWNGCAPDGMGKGRNGRAGQRSGDVVDRIAGQWSSGEQRSRGTAGCAEQWQGKVAHRKGEATQRHHTVWQSSGNESR